jgi:hypothetical protein
VAGLRTRLDLPEDPVIGAGRAITDVERTVACRPM